VEATDDNRFGPAKAQTLAAERGNLWIRKAGNQEKQQGKNPRIVASNSSCVPDYPF
jgi:hypothetical protein